MEMVAERFEKFGISETAVLKTEDIPFCESLRKLCEKNACGNYKKSWQCPPFIGSFEEIRARVHEYAFAVLCKSTHKISDCFDWDGMNEALAAHRMACKKIRDTLKGDFLHLAAGGCKLCDVCAVQEEKKCRFPLLAHAAPEAYSIDVTALAEKAGMEYGSGGAEVSYFDIFLIQKKDEKST